MTQVKERLADWQATIIFLTALVVRGVVVVGFLSGFLKGALKGADSRLYFEIANNLLANNGFATDSGATAFVSPLYPIFIAGTISLFGEHPIIISTIQTFLSALTCVYIAKIAGITFNNKRIELFAGLFAVFNFELVLWANAQLITEPLYVTLLAAAIMTLCAALRWQKTRYFALSGLFFALASLTRPISIGLMIGVLTLVVFSLFLKKCSIPQSLIFATVFILVMLPWGFRNHYVMGGFTISSLEGGHVLWLGNNPEFDRFDHPDMVRYGGYTTMFSIRDQFNDEFDDKTQIESDAIFRRAAIEHIVDNPKQFFIRGVYKNWNMWRPAFSGSSWRNKVLSYTIYPLMLISALFGMAICWFTDKDSVSEKLTKPYFYLIAIFFMHILIHSVITGEIRFRVPTWIVLIPFSAFTFFYVFRRSFFVKSLGGKAF